MTLTRAICLGLLGLAGCGDDTPAVFITDHLVVEPSDSEVMCRGTLDDMEAQAVRVAEAFGVGIPYPIQVYYGPSAVDEHCSSLDDGCAKGLGEDTYIAADASLAYHELVHAVRFVNGRRGPRFFEEGVAEVLSGIWPRPYEVEVQADEVEQGPEFLATVPWDEFQSLDYGIAGHFMSWLFVTYGDETVVAFLNDETLEPDAAEAAFENNFGLSLHDAEEAWRSSSEVVYSWGELCDPLHDLTWDGPVLEFKGRLDCNAPDTIGPSMNNMHTRNYCFTLDQPSTLRVELVAPGGRAYLRCVESDNSVPVTPEHFQAKEIPAGEALDLPFAQCTWRLAVETDVTEPSDFSLRLTRL